MEFFIKPALIKFSKCNSVVSFLQSFKSACDSNNVHDGISMMVLPRAIRELFKGAFLHCKLGTKNNDFNKDRRLVTCRQVAMNLLETCATHDINWKAKACLAKYRITYEHMNRLPFKITSGKISSMWLECARV